MLVVLLIMAKGGFPPHCARITEYILVSDADSTQLQMSAAARMIAFVCAASGMITSPCTHGKTFSVGGVVEVKDSEGRSHY